MSYLGYTIKWWNDIGFFTTQGNFDLLAKIVATKNSEFIGFAFYVPFNKSTEDDLDKLAIEKVKNYLDTKKVSDKDMFTFEFNSTRFHEIQNPEWWDTKYSKSLVPGLRVEADITHPTTEAQKGWRVILHFKSKQGDYWATTTFGKNNRYHEYFVWVDSKELMRLGLPNTAKSAEIVAIDYGIKRFEETKDKNDNREITRINENNATCFGGKCIKDSLLPEEK